MLENSKYPQPCDSISTAGSKKKGAHSLHHPWCCTERIRIPNCEEEKEEEEEKKYNQMHQENKMTKLPPEQKSVRGKKKNARGQSFKIHLGKLTFHFHLTQH